MRAASMAAKKQSDGVLAATIGIVLAWTLGLGVLFISLLTDPTYGGVSASFATFNPHLTAGSLALGLGKAGVDAGAYPFGAGAPDLTPPAAIANLLAAQINDNNLLLSWTAPGDDGPNWSL